jgi:hypothetical protein
MSRPTLEQIIRAVYVNSVNLNGICPYCRENMSGMLPSYKEKHLQKEHLEEG